MKRIIQILLGFVVLALPTTASAAVRTLYATSNYYEIISRNGLLGNKNTVETPTFTLDNQYKNDQLVNITWQMKEGSRWYDYTEQDHTTFNTGTYRLYVEIQSDDTEVLSDPWHLYVNGSEWNTETPTENADGNTIAKAYTDEIIVYNPIGLVPADCNYREICGYDKEVTSPTFKEPISFRDITTFLSTWETIIDGEWCQYYGDKFTEGVYRVNVVVSIDDTAGDALSIPWKLLINNEEYWTTETPYHILGSHSYANAYSPAIGIGGEPLQFETGIVNIPENTKGIAIKAVSLSGGVTGGFAPYTFSKVSGPDWITVSDDGVVSGTPTAVGSNEDLVVRVTDIVGTTAEITIPVGNTVSKKIKAYVSGVYYLLDTETLTAKVYYDDTTYAEKDEGKYTLKKIQLPAKVSSDGQEYTVTEIGDYVFYKCTSLTSITLPATLKSIGESAFAYSGVYNMTLPEGLTYIGKSAFEWGANLYTVSLPETLTSIGKNVFANCWYLNQVSLPATLVSIGDNAFAYCSAIYEISLPAALKSIGNSAFEGCTHLTGVNCPEALTSIGNGAFAECTALESVTLPEALTAIGESTFAGCTHLTSVSLPDNIASIGESAFAGCTRLGEINFPENLSTIGAKAFQNCSPLKTLEFGSKITKIGELAFNNCDKVTKITINALTPPEIGNPSSSTTASLPYSYYNYEVWILADAYDDYKAHEYWSTYYLKFKPIKHNGLAYRLDSKSHKATVVADYDAYNWESNYTGDIVIPEYIYPDGETAYAVTAIGEGAFAYAKVTGVTFQGHLESVGQQAFQYSHITKIDFSNVNPDGLGRDICGNCPYLQSVILPEGLTRVPTFMFLQCPNLRHITLPESVTEVGDGAFMESGLESVVIPPRCRNIDSDCFSGCLELAAVHLPTGLRTIGYSAFSANYELKTIEWYDTEEYEDETDNQIANAPRHAAASDPGSLTYHLTYIGEQAFANTGLTYFYVPRTVEEIGFYSFYNSPIARLDVGATTIPTLDTQAFAEEQYNTTLIFVPDGMVADYKANEAWGQFKCYPSANDTQMYAFADEEETQVYYAGETSGSAEGNYTVPDVVTDGENTYDVVAISASALKGTAVTSVELPASVVCYGNSAFEGCESLESVSYRKPEATPVIAKVTKSQIRKAPKAATASIDASLGKNAFYGCTSLTSVELPENITSIPDGAFRECSSLTAVEIPETVTEIGRSAFEGSAIQSVEIPASIYSIGSRAFKDCTSLTSVSMPENLYQIDSQTFMGCTSLKSITIPESVNQIGSQAFADVDFESVISLATYPPNVENENAFSNVTYANAYLYVPEEATDYYKTADVWSKFSKQGLITGIEAIETDAIDADAEYYNLQGVKIVNPTSGIYIRRQGTKIDKVIIKK